MNEFIWGAFKLVEGTSEPDKIALAFKATLSACDNKIGIKLGWNVRKEYREELKNKPDYLPFELTDNPLTNIAEEILIPDGGSVTYKNTDGTIRKIVTPSTSLQSRVNRIQNFLETVINDPLVTGILVHFDTGFREDIQLDVQVGEFARELLAQYEKDRGGEPSLGFVLRKQ